MLADIGFEQQYEIFMEVQQRGLPHVIIDSFDIRANPAAALRTLCDTMGLEFDREMLTWPAGGHAADGVWARHWYDAVHRSTGFAGPEGALPDVPAALNAVADAADPFIQG